MGKFHGFGIGRAPEPESPSHMGVLKQHMGALLHPGPPRSTMASPSGKPPRYSNESDEADKPQQLIQAVQSVPAPAAIPSNSRLQVPLTAPPQQVPPPTQHQQLQPPAPVLSQLLTHSSQQEYSKLASKMLNMVNELRAAGADVALQLPTVVVCGQQSAGKSSVVEAICGIPLPRNQETCTRCPTEVRLSQQLPSNGSQWEAVVKLRREQQQGAGITQSAWHQQEVQQQQDGNNMVIPSAESQGRVLESVFRPSVRSPDELPAAVQAAQTALLSQSWHHRADSRRASNHNSNSSSPVKGTPGAAYAVPDSRPEHENLQLSQPLKFTRDVVVVEVHGAPVDLTLIDLPGVIHSVERPEDEHYKHLVADLVDSYMRRPGVIIVPAITCKEDIDTQVILSMARDADPRGERTLGVLTKPDQIEEGCHGQWLQVLSGDRYPLALGWYAVKNPNQAALVRGTNSTAARQQEEAFFAGTPPWNKLPPAGRNRLCVVKLREAMSKQLVKLISVARPGMLAAAQAQLVALRAELANMPPAAVLGDGHAELLRLIDDVSANLQEEILAHSQSKKFYQHLLMNFQHLRSRLASGRPCFLLPRGSSNSNGHSSSTSHLVVTCALDDDLASAEEAKQQQQQQLLATGRYSDSSGGPNPLHKAGPGSFDIFSNTGNSGIGGSNSSKLGLGAVISGGSAGAGSSDRLAVLLAACPHQVLLPPDGPEAAKALSLEDVRQLVQHHHSFELPGFSPYSAVQDLVSKHQRDWGPAVAEAAAGAHRQLLELVLLHVGHTFERFPRAADHIRELATELLEELFEQTTTAVESLVAMELSGAFAVARREFSRASNQHLEGLRALLASSAPVQQPLAAAAAVGAEPGGSQGHGNSGSNAGDSSRPGTAADASGWGSSKRLLNMAAAGGFGSAVAAVAAAVLPHHKTGLYEPGPGVTLAPIPATATGPSELLTMMAVVLTYYGISCRRLSDTVSMSIMHILINSFTAKFRSRLASGLLSLSSDSVAALLVEDGQSAARRAQLKAQTDMLEQAIKVMRAAV